MGSFLFSGTVLDNIRFGRPEATRAEVEAAARAVGADQVIAGLPDGYGTQVGERGTVESGTPAELRARGGRFAELFDRWVAGAA
jgi:ATP-binding cassette, subfamily B, bacterial